MTVTGAVMKPVDPAISAALASAQIAIEAAATALDAAQRAVLAVVYLVQEPSARGGDVPRGTPLCPGCQAPSPLDVTTMGVDGRVWLCGECGHQWSESDG